MTVPMQTGMTGKGFAFFRSHALHTEQGASWYAPGWNPFRAQTNYGNCACGDGYLVSNEYHWHDLSGKCHNRVACV